jgi:hypothetical protein
VLRALLHIPELKGGARSLETLCEYLKHQGKNAPQRAHLPANALLTLHVDPEAFWAICERDSTFKLTAESLAEGLHNLWLSDPGNRGVAHEIGHYLLATPTHADSGLMRASIDAREFADPGARTFALDDTAGQWLRGRLLDATPSATDLRLPSAGFTYGQPSDTTGSGR